MTSLRTKTIKLQTALGMLLVGGAFVGVFFAGRYVALAGPGKPGGASAGSLGFAGTLRQNGKAMPSGTALSFAFKRQKDGAGGDCPDIKVSADPDPTSGSFQVEIPLNACAEALFDGGDVFFDVKVGSTPVVSGQQALAVPYAKFADQAGTPDCPAGYARDAMTSRVIVCQRKVNEAVVDEVVRVGTGTSAFWVDRYEVTIWGDRDGTSGAATGGPYGASDNIPIPKNGQWLTDNPTAYALSKPGVPPSRFVTWFQANTACRASGKRLPQSDEWLEAARGTPDPAVGNDGTVNSFCNTLGKAPRSAGKGEGCESRWGAREMVGNVWEWTADWEAGLHADLGAGPYFNPWPGDAKGGGEYGGDVTFNIVSSALRGDTTEDPEFGLPAAVARGGAYSTDTNAGVFAMDLIYAPSGYSQLIGFRCVTPR